MEAIRSRSDMRPIPDKIRRILAQDSWMKSCAKCGSISQVEFHHCWTYSRRQISEVWAIIGLCHDCHNKPEIKNDFAKLISLERANAIYKDGIKELYKKYPKFSWMGAFDYLTDKILPEYMPHARAALDSGMNLAEQFPQIREW